MEHMNAQKRIELAEAMKVAAFNVEKAKERVNKANESLVAVTEAREGDVKRYNAIRKQILDREVDEVEAMEEVNNLLAALDLSGRVLQQRRSEVGTAEKALDVAKESLSRTTSLMVKSLPEISA